MPTLGLSIVPYLYAVSFLLFFFFIKRGGALKATGEAPLLDASLFSNLPFTVGMSYRRIVFSWSTRPCYLRSRCFCRREFASIHYRLRWRRCRSRRYSRLSRWLRRVWVNTSRPSGSSWLAAPSCSAVCLLIGQNLSMTMQPTDVLFGMLVAGRRRWPVNGASDRYYDDDREARSGGGGIRVVGRP